MLADIDRDANHAMPALLAIPLISVVSVAVIPIPKFVNLAYPMPSVTVKLSSPDSNLVIRYESNVPSLYFLT